MGGRETSTASNFYCIVSVNYLPKLCRTSLFTSSDFPAMYSDMELLL